MFPYFLIALGIGSIWAGWVSYKGKEIRFNFDNKIAKSEYPFLFGFLCLLYVLVGLLFLWFGVVSLTSRSSRTPPALPFALSQHLAIPAPLVVSAQARPLSCFR